jgi:hypothetical protein
VSKSRITVVLEYPSDADVPQFSAGMNVLGGTVVAVQFSDALKELEQLENPIAAECPQCGKPGIGLSHCAHCDEFIPMSLGRAA